MTWIKNCYQSLYGYNDINSDACVTGKSVIQGGIEGRKESTGVGAIYCLTELMKSKQFCETFNFPQNLTGKKIICGVIFFLI